MVKAADLLLVMAQLYFELLTSYWAIYLLLDIPIYCQKIIAQTLI